MPLSDVRDVKEIRLLAHKLRFRDSDTVSHLFLLEEIVIKNEITFPKNAGR